MKRYEVLSLGESIVDFVPIEGTLPGKFQVSAGGAPTNVACGLARLGAHTALLSRVGDDPLGECILKTAASCGVDTSYIQKDKERFTTVTIVMPKTEDMLRYAIYGSGSASGELDFTKLPKCLFKYAKLLHYGSLCMAFPTARQTTLLAIKSAHENGMTTSVDVNLRPNSWKNERDMIKWARKLVELSDIVKFTKEELEKLGLSAKELGNEGKIVLVTNGSSGAAIYNRSFYTQRPALDVDVCDVTGSGDAFMSAFLYYYLERRGSVGITELLEGAIDFCIRASAVAVKNYGAIESLPTLEDIRLLENSAVPK